MKVQKINTVHLGVERLEKPVVQLWFQQENPKILVGSKHTRAFSFNLLYSERIEAYDGEYELSCPSSKKPYGLRTQQ